MAIPETSEPRKPVTTASETGCCGGAAPDSVDACCDLDARIKSTGGAGCGCAPAPAAPKGERGCCG